MGNTLELSWDQWVKHNLERGCDAQELHAVLVSNGFDKSDASTMLSEAGSRGGPPSEVQPSANTGDSGIENFSSEINLPTALRIESNSVELYGVENFLNEDECLQLIQLIRTNLQRSTTAEEGVSGFRTSQTCNLAQMNHPIVEKIDKRICAFMGIDAKQSEPIQGQWYERGQEFKAHTDFFDPGSASFDKHIGDSGQRSWTFMIYLNTTRKGGATDFEKIGIKVEPAAGTALLWNNRNADGSLNYETMHHGTPVEKGYKAVITKWFRSVDAVATYSKEANEQLTPLTRAGFMKCNIPADVYSPIKEFYEKNRNQTNDESLPDFIQSDSGNPPSVLIELPDELRQKIHEKLKPVVEAWVGDYLEATYVYGIREYRRGAELKMHRDRLLTHVASLILNIDQEVDEDWPLSIEDHHYREHNVFLKPGEMILYEGARLSHGRPEAFNGTRFANVFVHFKLLNAT